MRRAVKIVLISLAILALIILSLSMMFLFVLCPPKGPWPSPPWCRTYSPVFHEFEVQAQPLSQIKAVQMSDTWGKNYNFGMQGVTWKNIESSFDRIKEMGAEEVYIHDMHQVKYTGKLDLKSTNYRIVGGTFWDDLRDEEISQKHLNKLAEEAHKKGLKIGYKNNLAFVNIGDYVRYDDIAAAIEKDTREFKEVHTEEWVRDFFRKWEERMILKAEQLNKAGFDIMSVTPTWMGPTFRQNEELANELWKELIISVKEKFNGEVHVIIPFNGFDYEEPDNPEMENTQVYDYYKEADLVQVNFFGLHERYFSEGTSVEEMREAFNNFLDELEVRAEERDVKFSIKFSAFSYENSVNFVDFVEYHDIRNPEVLAVIPDYQHQADQYQAFFQAINKRDRIERIIVGGFWWDDAMDPEVKVRISLSPSPRNKPAETAIKTWFNK